MRFGLLRGGFSLSIPLFYIGGREVELVYLIDYVGILFLIVVAIISSCVFFYVKFYIGDTGLLGFNWLVMMFIISMGILIFRGNVFSMMLG